MKYLAFLFKFVYNIAMKQEDLKSLEEEKGIFANIGEEYFYQEREETAPAYDVEAVLTAVFAIPSSFTSFE